MRRVFIFGCVLMLYITPALPMRADSTGAPQKDSLTENLPPTEESTGEPTAELTAKSTEEPTAESKAQAHFKKGKQLFESGQYKEAAVEFTIAYDLSPHPAVKANIGLCYESIGDVARAYTLYRECVADSNYEPPKWLIKNFKKLESRVVELHVTCLMENCKIEIDSRELTTNPIYLAPGEHVAVAYSGERKVAKVIRQFSGGEKANIVLVPPSEEAAPVTEDDTMKMPPKKEQQQSSSPALGVSFWVSAGVTVASATAMTVLGVKTIQTRDEYDNISGEDTALQAKGEKYRTATNVMLAVTLTAALTTAVLGYLKLRQRRFSLKSEVVTVRATPFALAVEGRF